MILKVLILLLGKIIIVLLDLTYVDVGCRCRLDTGVNVKRRHTVYDEAQIISMCRTLYYCSSRTGVSSGNKTVLSHQ